MPTELGGYFIRFDEEQRAEFLLEVASLDAGFSDALSRHEWPLREWNVCGLLFEPDVVTHWALARKGKKVATGKVRVEFIEVTPTRVSLPDLERLLGSQFRLRIGSVRSGTGGRVPPVTWERMKDALGSLDPSSRQALERLERIRDQSDRPILRPGAEIVAHQRDAVGIALDAFDPTNRLRKRTLKAWAPPQGTSLTSFLAGVDVRTIEDQLIARDAAVFPGADETRLHVLGAVFAAG